MQDQDGREGFLVRVGDIFMYVRNRAVALPHGGSLADLVSGVLAARSADAARLRNIIGTRAGWLVADRPIEPAFPGRRRSRAFVRAGSGYDNDARYHGVRRAAHANLDCHRTRLRCAAAGRWISHRLFNGRNGQAMTTTADFSSIPIVDIAKLRTGTLAEQQAVAEELGKAARTVGFVYITGGGIDEALFDGVLDATKRFFALPHEEKMKVYIGNSKCHRGYVPEGEEVFASGTKDKKEAYDLSMDLPADDPDYRRGNPLLGPNQWPDLPGFAQCGRRLLQGRLRSGPRSVARLFDGDRRGAGVLRSIRHQAAEPVAAHPLSVRYERGRPAWHRRAYGLRVLYAAKVDGARA